MSLHDHQHATRRRWWLLAGLALAALAWTMPATAEVLDISADGVTAVRSGSGVVRWSGRPDRSEGSGAVDPNDFQPADTTIPAIAVLGTASPRAPAAYAAALARAASRYDLSPALLEALVWQESRWRADAVSPAGAIGLAQLMPATARALGVDPRDPVANLDGGARFLRAQLDLFDGDLEKALAAYNAGPKRVLNANGIPNIAETRAYVAAIIGRLAPFPNGD